MHVLIVCPKEGRVRRELTHHRFFADQELDTKSSTRVVYWEGSVVVEGAQHSQPVRGVGYVELVGYKGKVGL